MAAADNTFKFSTKALDAITVARRTLYYDSACPGLGVRISPSGHRKFFHSVNRTRIDLDTTLLETARQLVRRRQSQQTSSTPAVDWTLGRLFQLWMELKARPKKRTWRRDQSRWEQYLQHWEKQRLADITRLQCIELHNKINETNGPYAANDTLAFVSSLYNYAETLDYHGRNPAAKIERFQEQERERYLLPAEFPQWHAAVMGLRVPEARDFFLLALWTGVRRECVLSMRWEQIDLRSATWTIPNEMDKGKRDLIVYLSQEAMTVLEQRKQTAVSEWVLPSRNGSKSGHYADPKAAWKSVLRTSGINDLRIHDLRRTLGSWMAEGGVSLPIIGKALGHKSLQATRIYARLGAGAVRDAVNDATRRMIDTLE